MDNIVYLKMEEKVHLDRDQLEVLFLQLGAAGVDQLVTDAMEEMAVLLAHVEKCNRDSKLDEVHKGVKGLVSIAQQIGMTKLARVGRDVLLLLNCYDSAAYGAALARLVRIGECSLVAVWDMQGMSI